MQAAAAPSRSLALAKGLLLIPCALALVFGTSAAFVESAAHDEAVLIATFGPGMGLFGIALTLIAVDRADRRAWLALWWLPVFFAVHVAALGTWVPDVPLALMATAGLLIARPAARSSRRAAWDAA